MKKKVLVVAISSIPAEKNLKLYATSLILCID